MKRGSVVLLLALATLPSAAAGAPFGLRAEGGPTLHLASGVEDTLVLLVANHRAEPATVRVNVYEITHLDVPGEPGQGITLRDADRTLTLAPGEEARVEIGILARGATGTWRLTASATDAAPPPGAEAPDGVVTWIDVRVGPSLLAMAASPVGLALAGVAAASVVALAASSPRARGLLAAPFVALYSRVRRDDALAQQRRERLHALIEREPGIAYAELMAASGLGAGVLTHHLRVLERAGLVRSARANGRRRFFAAGAAKGLALPTEAQSRVLEQLRSEALTQRELCARLGLSQQGVSYHLANLERAGLVVREDGRRWRGVSSS